MGEADADGGRGGEAGGDAVCRVGVVRWATSGFANIRAEPV